MVRLARCEVCGAAWSPADWDDVARHMHMGDDVAVTVKRDLTSRVRA